LYRNPDPVKKRRHRNLTENPFAAEPLFGWSEEYVYFGGMIWQPCDNI